MGTVSPRLPSVLCGRRMKRINNDYNERPTRREMVEKIIKVRKVQKRDEEETGFYDSCSKLCSKVDVPDSGGERSALKGS